MENARKYGTNGMVSNEKRALTIKLQIENSLESDVPFLRNRFARKRQRNAYRHDSQNTHFADPPTGRYPSATVGGEQGRTQKGAPYRLT
jgi:hypothetical protein